MKQLYIGKNGMTKTVLYRIVSVVRVLPLHNSKAIPISHDDELSVFFWAGSWVLILSGSCAIDDRFFWTSRVQWEKENTSWVANTYSLNFINQSKIMFRPVDKTSMLNLESKGKLYVKTRLLNALLANIWTLWRKISDISNEEFGL